MKRNIKKRKFHSKIKQIGNIGFFSGLLATPISGLMIGSLGMFHLSSAMLLTGTTLSVVGGILQSFDFVKYSSFLTRKTDMNLNIHHKTPKKLTLKYKVEK